MRETVCGKNRERPSVEELVEDDSSTMMATAYSGNDVIRSLQKSKQKAPAKTKDSKKKVDAVTLVLGPPLRSPTPVVVFTGGAEGVAGDSAGPASGADSGPGAGMADVPLPTPRPRR
ncbi:MAG: hypothetical protein R3D02_01740 [Hyphomicrobiales bacterium]